MGGTKSITREGEDILCCRSVDGVIMTDCWGCWQYRLSFVVSIIAGLLKMTLLCEQGRGDVVGGEVVSLPGGAHGLSLSLPLVNSLRNYEEASLHLSCSREVSYSTMRSIASTLHLTHSKISITMVCMAGNNKEHLCYQHPILEVEKSVYIVCILTSPHLTSPHFTSPHLTSPFFILSHILSHCY